MTDGVTLAQAIEVQRLYRRDFLSPNQIAKIMGINLMMIAGVISGRYFPESLEQWEGRE
jgi:hypothetical protein